MSVKKRFKKFQRTLARYGLYTSSWLFERLPHKLVAFITNILVTIGFSLTIRQRKIAEESMDIAFGNEKTPEEKQAIIKKCFRGFGRGMMEMLYCLAHPDQADNKVFFENKETLNEALAKGKALSR